MSDSRPSTRQLLNVDSNNLPQPEDNGREKGSALCIRDRGFTLAELAIVLVIVMLIISGMLVPFGTQIQNKRIADTQRTLEEIKDALIGYAVVNKRLPKPSTILTGPTAGTETATCTLSTNCSGFIPWVTLGVPKSDAWGKIIQYSVTHTWTTTITISSTGNKDIYTSDASSLVRQADDVPVVLLSFGAKNFGTSDSGAAIANVSTTNIHEIANNLNATPPATAPASTFITRPTNDNPGAFGGEFDDILAWIPTNVIISRMVAAGQLP